jgi:hypothetical protein
MSNSLIGKGIPMAVRGAQTRVTKEVTSWAGVATHPHRFPGTVRSLTPSRQGQVQDRCGGVKYVIGKREIGHIHGDHLVDIPFPKKST